MERELGRFLVVTGAMIILIGLFLSAGGRLGLGHLPGDISVSRGNVRIYIPLGSCILLSVVLTILFRLLAHRS
jgi:Protein of unknown function (DUF2905)